MSDTDRILAEADHRPWPLPRGPWIMFQSWRDLLFAHWRVEPERIRPLVPGPIELETFDGSAWLGLTPFRVEGLRPRFLPALPGPSSFPEMNLRTYVRVGDKPGILFFTLDAGSPLAVAGARTFYRLPYRNARMSVRTEGEWIVYASEREDGSAVFRGRYRATGPEAPPRAGTLEHFLTERYALYTTLRDGSMLRGEIHHRPWPLRTAEAEIEVNTVPEAHGVPVGGPPDLLHFSARQDTLVWPPVPA